MQRTALHGVQHSHAGSVARNHRDANRRIPDEGVTGVRAAGQRSSGCRAILPESRSRILPQGGLSAAPVSMRSARLVALRAASQPPASVDEERPEKKKLLQAANEWVRAFFKDELRRRAFITLLCILVLRVGYFTPISGYERRFMGQHVGMMGHLAGALDVMGDQADSVTLNVFELGVGPYIFASIMMQVLCTVPDTWFATQKKEGAPGYERIQKATRYMSLAFALAMASYTALESQAYALHSFKYMLEATLTFTAGSMIVTYLGDAISQFGMGGGSTVIIGLSIVGSYGTALHQLIGVMQSGAVPLHFVFGALLLFSALVAGGVWITEGVRKVPISYFQLEGGAKQGSARDIDNEYIPFKVNPSGMQPVLIAAYVMDGPRFMAGLLGGGPLVAIASFLNPTLPAAPGACPAAYYFLFFVVIFSSIFLDLEDLPKEINEYLGRVGARVRGVKPGPETVRHLRRVQASARFWGGLWLGLLATFGQAVDNWARGTIGVYVGFTSLLIVVGMIQQTRRQVEAYAQVPRMEAMLSRQLGTGKTS